jgi:hypothetical protein
MKPDRASTKGVKPRAYRDLLDRAVAQGWTLTWTGDNHIRLDPPSGHVPSGPVFGAGTSGGGRGVQNLRALLRRHGVDC